MVRGLLENNDAIFVVKFFKVELVEGSDNSVFGISVNIRKLLQTYL